MGQNLLSTDPKAGLGRSQKATVPPPHFPRPGEPSSGPEDAAPSDAIARLMSMLEPLAHPQSWSDFGHLLTAGAVPTTIGAPPTTPVPQGLSVPIRKPVGSLVEKLGQLLQHPVQAPGKIIEGAGRMVKGGPPPTPETPPLPPPRPGSFEEFMTAGEARRAEIMKAREAFRLTPRGRTASPAPPETPSAAPPASTPRGSAPAGPAPTLELTPEEADHVRQLLAEGHNEADVMQAVARVRQQTQSTPPLPSSMSVSGNRPTQTGVPSGSFPRGIQNADELKEFERLLAKGTPRDQALQMIQQLRQMQQSQRVPSPANMRSSIAKRDAAGPGGKWPKDWNIWRPNE